MKVLMVPHLDKLSGNLTTGIDQVIDAYFRYLPEFDVELVPLDAENYDLIAAHAGLTGPVNDVCHLHGLHWSADYDAPDWEYRVNQKIVEAVRHAKTITVPSEWVAETIRRDLRVNPVIIPHGIDWQRWQHHEPQGDYILWNKNRADAWICDPGPVARLALEFPKAHFVTTFMPDKTPAPANVNVTGVIPHPEMRKLVQSAAVYLATVKETGGIGILEAMAAGVPILGYAHGAITDLVQHGVSGYLAAPGDIDDLAEGLRYCVRHRAVLGANARELARGWSWSAACEKVAEAYRMALEPEPPTVGVVIPVYNKSEQELRRAVESVVHQTYRDSDIIVVDDGSTDSNSEIYRQVCAGYSVRYVRQNNSGVANARNNGIGQTASKYICCLDSDDWIEPDFIRTCVRALETDRSLGIAYTRLRWHKPDGTTGISEWPGKWDYDAQLKRQNQIPTCCVFRREMWARLGGYRQRYAPGGAGAEDGEFWLRAGAYGWKAGLVTDDALFNYSWMSGQVTGDPDYKEVDWLAWHPWTKDGQHPFASYAKPRRYSHPVRAYDRPAVSVVIPVGPGHEKEVVNALDSLEAQTFRKWEAIVVWDGIGKLKRINDDNKVVEYQWEQEQEAIHKAYPYVKFRSIGTDKPRGAGWARNFGASFARAPFLLFLDADDWLYPEALQKMINAWNAHRGIVYTDYVGKAIVDNPGRLAADLQERLYSYDERRQEAVIGYRAFDFDCERALRQPELPNPYIWCNVTSLIPKSWHDDIGGFDESMDSWEDVDYHWRHARAGHCYHRLPEELMVYRFYTGGRRDRGLQDHQNLVKYITEKYEKEGNIVGCSSCPGGRRSNTTQTVFNVQRAETPGMDGDFIKVKYVKPLKGMHEVIGSNAINPMTQRRFSYGQHSYGDVFLVHQEDVYMLDRHSGTKVLRDPQRFQPMEEQVAEPPETGPRLTPAPAIIDLGAAAPFVEATDMIEVFDPQTLPGINAKLAAEFEARGLDSREAILALGAEGLQEIPGIGEKKAQKIIGYLSR